MAQDSSIAPKERINIRYKPATGDAKEDVELPLKMLIVGDFKTEKDETPVGERQRVNIDKDNFSDVMRSQNLKLEMSVPDRLTDGAENDPDAKLNVSLNISTLKDFSPDSIAAQVPELKKLVELRSALLSLKGPLGNMPTFRKAVQAMLDDEETRKKLLDELQAGKPSE
ncbi:type VI secretion system contractile sheath small subunit [Acidisoma sp. C75]